MRRIIWVLLLFSSCVEHDLSPRKTPCEESNLSILLENVTKASSCETNNGMIEVSASGGKRPYKFYLEDLNNESGLFDAVASGVYSVSVIDSSGCERVLNNILVTAEGFDFETQITPDTDCIDGNGSVEIVVNEGTPPFQFQFPGSDWSEVSSVEGLDAGHYEIGLKDASGCSASLSIFIPKAGTGTSWSDEIQPIMESSCALNGCHNGKSRPDLRLYKEAKFYADLIKSLTQDRSMPFEGTITQDQIDLIACWVDEGANDN